MKSCAAPLVALLLVAGSACDEADPPRALCGPSNCQGCCDPRGICVVKTTELSCGGGGSTCRACYQGESCISGSCVLKPPSTCSGCLVGTQCVDGNSPGACGKGGQPCKTCSGTEKCGLAGTCEPANCSCLPTQCCANGACLPGTSTQNCGTGGGACQACKPGEQCLGQQCLATPCNATSCQTGCCTAEGVCVQNPDQANCGIGGQICVECKEDEQCNTGLGKCEPRPVPSCVTTPCTQGCCDKDSGSCKTGDTNDFCGYTGDLCHRCEVGQLCWSNECWCDAATCKGCCQLDGTCAAGTGNDACGKSGTACKECNTPLQCSATTGECVSNSTCGTTCPGCCDVAGSCKSGDATPYCGSGGQNCQDCSNQGTGYFCAALTKACVPPSTSCTTTSCAPGFKCNTSSGACALDPSSRWTLRILSAEIAGSPKPCTKPTDCPDGKCPWDPYLPAKMGFTDNRCAPEKCWDDNKNYVTCPPDGQIDLYPHPFSPGTYYKTATIGETWWPKWNQDLYTGTAADFMSGDMRLVLADDNPWWSDDIIMDCKTPFEDWEFEGWTVVWNTPCQDEDMVSLTYQFIYAGP